MRDFQGISISRKNVVSVNFNLTFLFCHIIFVLKYFEDIKLMKYSVQVM